MYYVLRIISNYKTCNHSKSVITRAVKINKYLNVI